VRKREKWKKKKGEKKEMNWNRTKSRYRHPLLPVMWAKYQRKEVN
jgi:hypothetical protein